MKTVQHSGQTARQRHYNTCLVMAGLLLLMVATQNCTGFESASTLSSVSANAPAPSDTLGANSSLPVTPVSPARTPTPTSPPPSIASLKSPYVPAGYVSTFNDEFTSLNTISNSAISFTPGVKWYNGIEQCCMGSSDGKPGSMYPTLVNGTTLINPYSIDPQGGLDISLTLTGNWWSSGVMQTVDSNHVGFSQQYGYFEMEAQFPGGPGTWPAFWMLPTDTGVSSRGEIDIMEAYTQFKNGFCITLHDWNNDANSGQDCFNNLSIDTTTGYHVYGMLWTKDAMTFYVDGKQVWQYPTLAVMHSPYYLLVDLGVGGGWPTENTPSPSVMKVKYVRAYKAP
jgi:hypothetical protein